MKASHASEYADSVVRRYRTLQHSMLGLVTGLVSSPDALNTGNRGRFALKVRDAADLHYEEALRLINTITEEVQSAALSDVERDAGVKTQEVFEGLMREEIRDFVFGEQRDLAEFYSAQLERDTRAVLRYARDFSLRVLSVMNSSRMSQTSAQLTVRLSRSGPEMLFLDKRGRKWGAEMHIEKLIRAYVIKLYNEIYLYSLTLLGRSTARVRHEDEARRYQSMRFAIADPTLGLPLYEEIKGEVFHPNSGALVVAE